VFHFLGQERDYSCGFYGTGIQINSACYVETLKTVKTHIARVRLEKKGKILLQHDNARTHTSILTRETILEFRWTVLPHLFYSSDLVSP
jgi:hypothetical protein